MTNTVNKAFNNFNRDVVNLLSARTEKARSSRDWLRTQLNGLQNKEGLNFPFKYEEKHVDFGSFQRKTKIRELDDIDLMFCLRGDNAYYLKHSTNLYTIHTENAGSRLKYISNDNTLNSTRVINKFRDSLSQISHYKSADIHRRGEAATLKLSSYEWNFDIVPCFYTDTGIYLMPDGKGNWKPTDPRVDQLNVTTENQKKDGRLLQLIRTLKYYNKYFMDDIIKSYFFEILVINYSKSKNELSPWIDYDIKDFFDYISNAIFMPTYDPKGFQGDLNTLDFYQRQSISKKFKEAFELATQAILAEIDDKDIEKSINLWRLIFGDQFPQYT